MSADRPAWILIALLITSAAALVQIGYAGWLFFQRHDDYNKLQSWHEYRLRLPLDCTIPNAAGDELLIRVRALPAGQHQTTCHAKQPARVPK